MEATNITTRTNTADDYMQYAKDVARAEKEIEVEHWVHISFQVRNADRTLEIFHEMDMPRHMLDRWQWLINWRHARLVCQYPRKDIMVYTSYYDKRSGLMTGLGSLIGQVTAAKAQITKVERAIAQYMEYETQNNLFFNSDTDERLIRAKAKLEQKRQNYATIHSILRKEVEEHRKHPGKYKLFIGFKRLGIFDSISEAKKYADRSGLWGAFNLLGDKGYRDSWYVHEKEVRQSINQ